MCTKNLPGDKLVATLSREVTGADGAVLPAGSKVVLEVASVNRGGGSGAGASIDFRVRAVDDGARSYPASATVGEGPFERTAIEGRKGRRQEDIGGVIAGDPTVRCSAGHKERDRRRPVGGGHCRAKAGSAGGYDSCCRRSTVQLSCARPC